MIYTEIWFLIILMDCQRNIFQDYIIQIFRSIRLERHILEQSERSDGKMVLLWLFHNLKMLD
ncbi:hypothetical protein AN684_0225485 [Klebsiella pneumoniae subsp. pneumoniae]|nr:hypothetical protein APU09_27945 [Klebsiella pneumoniae]OCN24381.1 hypothetical protein AN657_0228090 [Klebsiella pneumoniae subsp. pneumoniae]OCN42097.1 hypothetical protein AN656_0220360 [Klebsiella pneumoniae subsp. pneumoniae]OCN84425.1 hypothetical protein AN677_0217690 [Klebsiella pneumoniae subsp. pneumoniae]OCN86203.1 hypothetical protein AN678_0221520 [Klebsiella pneumoniae subsp. pneumoniae]